MRQDDNSKISVKTIFFIKNLAFRKKRRNFAPAKGEVILAD